MQNVQALDGLDNWFAQVQPKTRVDVSTVIWLIDVSRMNHENIIIKNNVDNAIGYDFCWGYKTYCPTFIPDCDSLNNFVIGFRISGNMTSREFRDEGIFYTHTDSSFGCGRTLMATCLQCTSAYARYVYVLLPGRLPLVICEVEVFMEGD